MMMTHYKSAKATSLRAQTHHHVYKHEHKHNNKKRAVLRTKAQHKKYYYVCLIQTKLTLLLSFDFLV